MIESPKYGIISSIKGSLIEVKGLNDDACLYDLLKISKYNILGQVIQIYSDYFVAQCFENTYKLKLGESSCIERIFIHGISTRIIDKDF